jgi:predicted regulator of Ras-like GTPase activity (Roadblock/LC7/MglB family)
MNDSLTVLMNELTKGNPDVSGALLVDGAGRVRVSPRLDPELATAATALAVPLRDLLDRTAAELGCGAVASTLIEGERGSLAFADVDGERMVVVIGARGAAVGALRGEAVWLAERLRASEAA